MIMPIRVTDTSGAGYSSMIANGLTYAADRGVRVANITPALADELGLDFSVKGVTVISVENSVAARRFGIQAGDMVRGINGQEIGTIADLNRALGASRGWDIAIQRGAQMLRLSVN